MTSRLSGILKRRIRRFRGRIDPRVAKFCSRSTLGSALYYLFWDSSFRREQRSVLEGKILFSNPANDVGDSSVILRRNIHRIEKGIISRPRRTIFALDYIEETIDAYCKMLTGTREGWSESEELNWAHDVLETYFYITDSDPFINEHRSRFQKLQSPPEPFVPERANRRAPYPHVGEVSVVSISALQRLSNQRRSVRWYLKKKVPRELIDQAIMVARQSPSACNRQPFQFRIFDDQHLLKQVSKLPAGTSGFSHNFPCMVAVIGRLRNYFSERDRHVIYIDASLASMSFVLALESLGLGSCCINWPDIPDREEKARTLLNLAPDERPIMFISIGYPDPKGMVPYSEKKPLSQLRKYNFE